MTTDTLTAARAAFIAAGDKYRTMQAQADEAAAELQRLDGMTGAELLDDPGKAEAIAAERSTAEHLAKLRAEMAEAAQGRWQAAAVPVLLGEAEALGASIVAAEAELSQWQAKEQRLLDQLAAHAGTAYQRVPVERTIPGHVMLRQEFDSIAPREAALQAVLERLNAQQAALHRTAEGGEPLDVCALDDLPDALLPGGVVLTDRTARAAADSEAAQQAKQRRRRDQQERLAQLGQRFGIDGLKLADVRPGEAAVWAEGCRRAAALWQWGRVSDDDIAALAELAELAGVHVAKGALQELRAADTARRVTQGDQPAPAPAPNWDPDEPMGVFL